MVCINLTRVWHSHKNAETRTAGPSGATIRAGGMNAEQNIQAKERKNPPKDQYSGDQTTYVGPATTRCFSKKSNTNGRPTWGITINHPGICRTSVRPSITKCVREQVSLRSLSITDQPLQCIEQLCSPSTGEYRVYPHRQVHVALYSDAPSCDLYLLRKMCEIKF